MHEEFLPLRAAILPYEEADVLIGKLAIGVPYGCKRLR